MIFVWIGEKLNLTPNQLTVASLFLGLFACLFFLSGDYNFAIYGLIPFHLSKIIDCADGQLAKLTSKSSKMGAFLDPFFDRIIDLATLTSLSYWYLTQTNSKLALYLIVLLVCLWYLDSYLTQKDTKDTTQLLKSSKEKFSGSLKRLLTWDGGFSGLIYSLAIIHIQIPSLIIIYLAVASVGFASHLYRIMVGIRNEESLVKD